MKQFSGWQALFLSFCSPALYRDVARSWTGLGFLYLLAVISITSLFVSIQINNWVAQVIDQNVSPICEQMPKLSIDNGKATIDKTCPYKVTDPKTGRVIITFDTRDSEAVTENLSEGAIVVTSSKLIMVTPKGSHAYNNKNITKDADATKTEAFDSEPKAKTAGTGTRRILSGAVKPSTATFSDPNMSNSSDAREINTKDVNVDFSTVPHFSLDRSSLSDLAQFYKRWTWLFAFGLLMPMYFIFCLIQVLIYGLFGMAMSRMVKSELSYAALVRLSVVALTPVLLIDCALKVRGIFFSSWGPVALLITLAYLFFAVKANSQPAPAPSGSVVDSTS